jgi:hypothetical protein
MSWAASIVVPLPAEGTIDGQAGVLRNAARSYQQFIDSSQLAGISSPVLLTGMQFRLAIGTNWQSLGATGTSWPSVPISFAQYDVQLSQATEPLITNGQYLSLVPTFASYQASDVTTVRSGAMNIPAGAFLADGGSTGTHSFGYTIDFTTPYAYTPGTDLVLMLRYTGYTGGALPAAFASSDPGVAHVADSIVSTTGGATAVTPTAFTGPAYVQFTYVPEPQMWSLVCFLALVWWSGRNRTVHCPTAHPLPSALRRLHP